MPWNCYLFMSSIHKPHASLSFISFTLLTFSLLLLVWRVCVVFSIEKWSSSKLMIILREGMRKSTNGEEKNSKIQIILYCMLAFTKATFTMFNWLLDVLHLALTLFQMHRTKEDMTLDDVLWIYRDAGLLWRSTFGWKKSQNGHLRIRFVFMI